MSDSCKCTNCQSELGAEHIKLQGFKPYGIGGLMIAEAGQEFSFCSHECFITWIASWLDRERVNAKSLK